MSCGLFYFSRVACMWRMEMAPGRYAEDKELESHDYF